MSLNKRTFSFQNHFSTSILRYDKWLAGEDYGRHPEEPNAKATPAPPPSVEEYLQNEDRYNNIKEALLVPCNFIYFGAHL